MQEVMCKMPNVTVRSFYEAGREQLDLHWEMNEEKADRVIGELALNRPGLALAGFVKYFANRRLQVLGLAETSYLKSLPIAERLHRLKMCGHKKCPAWILTRGRRVPAYVRDLTQQSGVPVLRTGLITGDFMNAATVLLENMTSPHLRLSGTMVDISGVGVLLQGPPGIGKSEIALALIERGHSLVADDTTILRRTSSGFIMGSAAEITRYHMEIRGLGLIHIPSLFGVSSIRKEIHLDLIIHMEKQTDINDIDRTGLDTKTKNVLGMKIPYIEVPIAPGRDLTHVVEVAALNQRCKMMGYNAAEILEEKLKYRLSQSN